MFYEHLEGRQFEWGKADCFALVRDFFWDNHQIAIPDFARPTGWDGSKFDLIRACYPRSGFEMIPTESMKPRDLRPGDVLAIAIGSSRPNHFAVYVGDNKICHHKANAMSNTELMRGFWRNYTSFYLRHPDVPDTRPVYRDVDIQELIDAATAFPPPAG